MNIGYMQVLGFYRRMMHLVFVKFIIFEGLEYYSFKVQGHERRRSH
jgi:hypothetical protein